MPDLVLKNGLVIPVTSEPKKADIVIENGEIIEINESKEKEYEGKELDLKNKAILPGLINTHTHASMSLLRGVADDLNLKNWLKKLRPLESEMNREDIYSGALLSCLEMVKNGITHFSDMYFYMDEVAEAAKEIGMRADLGYGMVTIDKDQEGIDKELEKGLDFFRKNRNSDLIDTFIAPHSVSTCSREFLERISEIKNAKIQMHVAETEEEYKECKNKYNKTVFELLDEVNLLKHDFLASHCVHVKEKDLILMKENDIKVSHNPNSNMKLASGVAPIQEMLNRGIDVSLGTDGAASNNSLDLFQEMKNASLLQKIKNKDASAVKAKEILEMATINGAKALGKDHQLGSIEEGKKADLVTINLNNPSINPKNNLISNIVYSGNNGLVDSVIVNGELIVHNKKLQKINGSEIIKKAKKSNKRLKKMIR